MNMELYTVSLFGHREIRSPDMILDRLEQVIQPIILSKPYVEFLVGREGEFDLLAASIIRRLKRKHDCGNVTLTLILPYLKAEYRDNEQEYLDYYDEVVICEESSKAHFKATIHLRNQRMVKRSDLIICYVERNNGGAYQAVQYAKRIGVQTINLAEKQSTISDN